MSAHVQAGDIFEQVNPPPGYHPGKLYVTGPAEIDGWWLYATGWGRTGSVRHIRESTLLNAKLYRLSVRGGEPTQGSGETS